MDKLTAGIVVLAILCATTIALTAFWKLTGNNPASKELAILVVSNIFAAISGSGVGYQIGKKRGTKGGD